MAERTSYTLTLPADKLAQLKADLAARGFVFRDLPHAHFAAEHRGKKVNVVAYHSGKLLIQGKGTADFVQFYLEPELLGTVQFGYETVLNPEMLQPRIGVDESGKGDFFGPLVVAGVYVSEKAARALLDLGARDSKSIASDRRIAELAKAIRKVEGLQAEIVAIGPQAYNRLHARMGSVNNILGWGHARVIENLLARVNCNRAIADQFGNPRIIEQALMQRGRKIQLVQRHRAESDLAVAAASILARDEFIRRLRRLSHAVGVELPKGASEAVIAAGREFVAKHGAEKLPTVAKMHFKTAEKILGKECK